MKDRLKRYIVENILEWGKENTDNFPWRKPDSLYHSIIAEILLIRTPPEQVLNIYQEFIKEFPSFEFLNEAAYEDIDKYIEKLGLKWRTERLVKLAQYLADNFENINQKSNEMNYQDLLEFPGLGQYTAAAVMTYYFKRRALPIDSNTVRFIRRYFNFSTSVEARRDKELYNIYDQLVPVEDKKAVQFNESFLDFMRKVCKNKKPECENCCVKKYCHYNSFN